ncbi:RB1-inducible coiled-coil protein [Tasmannia lanceolata]|uniref:RB1-inducible coiled-coil protein n=1 Tax=Tasmannia lanceolata TaxID=3420 RepID=UPI0040631FBF
MGGLLHLFDFNQTGTSRKLSAHKRHTDGLEAPRNSLELPIEASQGYHSMHENIPYSYQVKQHSLKKNVYPSGAPMKELIDEEMSKQTETKRNVPSVVARLMGISSEASFLEKECKDLIDQDLSKQTETRRNAPSVVARLMGMDMLPSDMKPMVHSNEKKDKYARNNILRKDFLDAENVPTHHSTLNSKPFKQMKQDFLSHVNKREPEQSRNSLKSAKLPHREHPQEEQLQKFKKEFEAWQASKVWERSRSVGLDNSPGQRKDGQTLAQELLNREKMARYAYVDRNEGHENHIQPKDYTLPIKLKQSGLQHGYRSENFQPSGKEATTLRNRTKTSDFEQFSRVGCDEKCGKSSLSTRIVILKPCPERTDDKEESWAGSSEMEEGSNSIEAFLEEVKERLRFEMQGNAKKNSAVRGAGVETPFSERPTDPKEIARHIAKQVRESVTRDLGMNLLRSESTRSYRSEIQFNEPGSPEFINRDTRKFLSERLKNVLRNETSVDVPTIIDGSSGSSLLANEGVKLRSTEDVLKTGKKVSFCENMKYETETKTRSFRHEHKNNEAFDSGVMSPRNLIRSLSAPVTGTSFGKLLLEEPHVLTGAHIRRKLEATENVSVEARKNRKDRFTFKGKVSNLRDSLSLKGRFFSKKIQSEVKLGASEFDSMKAFMTLPSVVMNLGTTQENSTEVPPSPASVGSSAHEELSKPGYHPSPVSPLDVPFLDDHPMPQIFGEISCSLHELRRQLTELQCDRSEEAATEEDPLEAEVVNLEGQAQVYIRDVLVASGLYEGSSKLTNSIDSRVFEEVEAAYREGKREGEADAKDHGDNKVNHKVLFDLLNEALATISGPSVTRSRFMRGIIGPTTMVPRGKNLLEDVWKGISIYVYPPMDGCHSLDGMVSYDLRMTPWASMMGDEIAVIGKEMEWMILGDLVEEVMRDM